MATIGNPPYKVGLTFNNATINFEGSSLEDAFRAKADAEHEHDLKDINDSTGVLTNLVSSCVQTNSSGNASIPGTFQCEDLRFTYNMTDVLLSEKISALDSSQNMTVQHLTLTSDPNVCVGYPVFYTGEITGKNFSPIIITSTDCVPIVKATGEWNTFAGICTEVDASYNNKTSMKYKGKDHVFIRFATHGDFQMAVNDSSKYKVGDLITYDGSIVDTSTPLDYKTMMSIVGTVSAIVKNNSVAIFRI